MTLGGMIFDIDGTLVDTNPAHVIAWQRAFARFGYEVPVHRIEVEIGKGGDKLVPSVLGDEVEKRLGEALRRAQKDQFFAIARSEHFRLFPGVPEIFSALRERGVRTALATSSDEKQIEATLASAGLDLTRLVDVVVTKNDAEESKPAPDIVVTALEKLAMSNAQCAMVGDTIYDGQACRASGIVFLGVLCGGTPEAELLEAGAVAVWRDVGHLLHDLDQTLEITHTGASAR